MDCVRAPFILCAAALATAQLDNNSPSTCCKYQQAKNACLCFFSFFYSGKPGAVHRPPRRVPKCQRTFQDAAGDSEVEPCSPRLISAVAFKPCQLNGSSPLRRPCFLSGVASLSRQPSNPVFRHAAGASAVAGDAVCGLFQCRDDRQRVSRALPQSSHGSFAYRRGGVNECSLHVYQKVTTAL